MLFLRFCSSNPFAAASHLPSRRNCGKFPFSNSSGRQQLARDGLMTDREARQTVQHRGMPPDESKDKTLLMAEGLLRGTELSSAFPPKVRDLSIRTEISLHPNTCHCSVSCHVRFGSLADICSAKNDVRFTPNSDRKSRHVTNVHVCFTPESGHVRALAHVCFGPIADMCNALARGCLLRANSGLRDITEP